MFPQRIPLLAVLAAGALGCSSPSTLRAVPVQQLFLHVTHRETYKFSEAELKEMRFYVSKNVLVARPEDVEVTEGGDTAQMLVRRIDPGYVTEVGPDWLRVSFAGGDGSLFVTQGTEEHQHYRFATELMDREGLFLVKDLADPAVYYEGHMYPVILGADTELLVNVEDMRDVLATRHIRDD